MRACLPGMKLLSGHLRRCGTGTQLCSRLQVHLLANAAALHFAKDCVRPHACHKSCITLVRSVLLRGLYSNHIFLFTAGIGTPRTISRQRISGHGMILHLLSSVACCWQSQPQHTAQRAVPKRLLSLIYIPGNCLAHLLRQLLLPLLLWLPTGEIALNNKSKPGL